MTWVFWISAVLVAYAYAGYPLWLWMHSQLRPRPVKKAAICPRVSIVIAVRNEAQRLAQKLGSIAALDYPADQREVIVVSDGSTDDTNRILCEAGGAHLKVILCPEHEGKAAAVNRGVRAATGEVVVFMDARQNIEPQALQYLVANFADPTVGCVSGELMLAEIDGSSSSEGIGLYWTIEKKMRQWESDAGSVVGATGALYAVRRELIAPLPAGTILDDVYIPLQVIRQGYRVVFEPQARAWDPLRTTPKMELRRKTRTLMGNYQLLQLAPWLLAKSNPVRFEFVSHKLMRLLVPFGLAAALFSCMWLAGSFYGIALAAQLGFYGLGLAVFLQPKISSIARPANLASSFLLLNAAAVMALINYCTGRKGVWVR